MPADTEGRIAWESGQTWYRIVGEVDPDSGPTPLVILHGGPGASHDYCEPIAELHRFGRACVIYDQLGCGKSDHLTDAPADFWSPQLFKDELATLTRHLGIDSRHAVVGQSWGGMLAMEYALDHPPGLRAIVVADSPASIPLWVSEANRLREDLPPDVQETLVRHEEAGTTDDPEYEAAVRVFYDRHLCRVPWPDCVQRSFDQIDADPTVYHTMNGPSEFHVIGSIKDWQSKDRLDEIDVPTLLVSGRHDEATPALQETLQQGIAGSEWVVFEDSSHLPHVEERERYMQVLGDWLRARD